MRNIVLSSLAAALLITAPAFGNGKDDAPGQLRKHEKHESVPDNTSTLILLGISFTTLAVFARRFGVNSNSTAENPR